MPAFIDSLELHPQLSRGAIRDSPKSRCYTCANSDREEFKMRVFIAALLFSAVTSAQTFRGAIQGTVIDSTGAAVPGAQITVTSVDTNLTRTVVTDDTGDYAFTELPLGAYKVTASKPGFRTETLGGRSEERRVGKECRS